MSGWIAKAESDLANAALCIANRTALDTACFHAQQAAEKYLKAYLTAQDMPFPLVHNLEKLVELCANRDPAFAALLTLAEELTPYAVELRYDSEFWPTQETAASAEAAARAIRELVLERLPAGLRPEPPGED